MEPSCTVSENVGATVKNNSVDPKKLKMELPYNPVIPLLGIHAKLFHDSTPLPHPSVNELIYKRWYTHAMQYYSLFKMNGIFIYAIK